MFLEFFVNFFVNRLSMENCIKLYAGILILNKQSSNRQEAIELAKKSERKDLRVQLFNLITYGPN